MSHGHRVLLKCARLVHVYLTMFGCLLILFFAVTGFMLNHEDWFGFEEALETKTTGTLPSSVLAARDKLALVELLRKDFNVRGPVEPFELDEEVLHVAFKSPGRRDDVEIQRADGQTTVTHQTQGVVALLTDLHRGKPAGPLWRLLIVDGVCVLLLIVSITGLVLWQSLRGRGRYGLLCMAGGLTLGIGGYFLFAA